VAGNEEIAAVDLVLLDERHVLAYFRPGASPRPEASRLPDHSDVERSDPLHRHYPFGSVATFDADGRYLSVAGQGWDALGIDPSDLVGRTFTELWDDETAGRLMDLAEVAFAGGQACQRVSWSGHVYEIWCGPLPPSADAGPRGMFISRDVSLEVSARRETQILQDATWTTSVGVVLVDVLDPEHPLVFVGKGFEKLTGYRADECVGRNCRFLQGRGTDPFTIHQLRTTIDEGSVFQGVIRNYRKDGSGFWNRLTLRPWSLDGEETTHYLGVQQDVTEQYEAQVEHERRSRLAELGALGSAIAHDFNNLLMEVQGRLEILRDAALPPPAIEEIEGIDGAVARGTDLVGQLLGQARYQEEESAGATRNARVSDLMPGVVRMLPRRIRVSWTSREEPGPIQLAPSKLEQVLLNLASNAADAMPDGGELAVGVEGEPGGRWATIRISDEGRGIPPALHDKVFDAFFTTKGRKGTGLGLSSVARIVNQVGGSVSFHSEVGSGTTFEVRLPLAAPSSGTEPTPSARDGASHLDPSTRRTPAPPHDVADRKVAEDPDEGAGLRALIAEDRPAILRTLVRRLRRRGFDVVAAEDGLAAWTAFVESGGAFDLVLTDQDMPGLSGQDLLARIADHAGGAADLPTLFLMSGALPEHLDLPAGTTLLPKPFKIGELLGRLRR
jgi:PAS domain S-box-containing protein